MTLTWDRRLLQATSFALHQCVLNRTLASGAVGAVRRAPAAALTTYRCVHTLGSDALLPTVHLVPWAVVLRWWSHQLAGWPPPLPLWRTGRMRWRGGFPKGGARWWGPSRSSYW